MKVLAGKSQQEILDTIENVVSRLAGKFRFGYFDIDDIKQEGRTFALEALDRYNETLPLENFLFVHVRNRLINLRRDHLKQHEPPCFTCPFYDPDRKKSDNQCGIYINKHECDKFDQWHIKTALKQSIIVPLDITNINDEHEDNMKQEYNISDNIDKNEVFDKIDAKLDVNYRADWLRLKSGMNITKNRKLKILEEVRKILELEIVCPVV